jgi:phosphatidylglycerol:prolipoprotein diacylglycerol transferase
MGPKLSDYWPFVPDWLPLHSYGVCVALGFFLAALLARRRARRVGVSEDAVMDLALWAIIAGIVGARIFYVIENIAYFVKQPLWHVVALNKGGLVFYGGFLTAIAVCAWYVRRKRLPVLLTLDICASVVMIGLAFGRIGCFSYGCCWGRPTDAWWGVIFPPQAPPYAPDTGIDWGTPLIPSQLVSALTAFVIFALTSLYFHYWRRYDGEVTAFLLIVYPINRFFLETLRHDTAVEGGWSVSQWISFPMALGGIAMMVWVYRRKKRAVRPPSETAEGAGEAEPADGGKGNERGRR